MCIRDSPEYDLRQKGKVATLAMGYQGGVGALINARKTYHIPENELPDEELPGIVQRWRQANRRIVAFWYAVEEMCIRDRYGAFATELRGLGAKI